MSEYRDMAACLSAALPYVEDVANDRKTYVADRAAVTNLATRIRIVLDDSLPEERRRALPAITDYHVGGKGERDFLADDGTWWIDRRQAGVSRAELRPSHAPKIRVGR